MTLEMNEANLAVLREYPGTIGIEGEIGDEEIVVRIRSDRWTAEQIYNELVAL